MSDSTNNTAAKAPSHIAYQVRDREGKKGFFTRIAEIFPTTEVQRCWVHKTANVLDNLPKNKQPKAKDMLHQIWMADTREAAGKAFDAFVADYQAKYPQATECLAKDRAVLLTFYDFPAEHWRHLRTTNPIKSTFATIRLRHRRTKRERQPHRQLDHDVQTR
jgi:putative transposase